MTRPAAMLRWASECFCLALAAQAGPTLSDSNLFAALDLNLPDLAAVKASVASTNYPAAKTNLAIYLRGRTNVVWTFDPRFPSNTVSYSKSAADQTTNAAITVSGIPYTFAGADIDWFYNVTKDPTNSYADNNEWQWQLNRMNFWPNLGSTYWGTSNEDYAACWVRQFRDWTTSCPVPGTAQNVAGSCWRTIESGLRMGGNWPNTYFRFLLAPSFTDVDICDYLKSCIEHGVYLRRFPTSGNWLTMEMSGLYTTAALFPEIRTSGEWRVYATMRLLGEQTNQFYPDGVQKELSPGYHGVAVGNILQIYSVAALEGRLAELPSNYVANLEKAYDHYLWLMTPDRRMPQFNDSIGASDARSALATAATLFTNRMDYLWVASRGASGAPPAQTSYNYPWAGYQVMRSGWSTNDTYLCLDAGPLGAAHQHEDKLNVVLWAFGREMLFDSGGGEYETSAWRTYGLSSFSHNTVAVDGKEQKGGDGGASYTDADYVSQSTVNARWESDVNRDFAAGVFDRGYGQYTNRPAVHTRRVLYVKPDLYVVADTLVPNVATSHAYEARWHLMSTNTTLDPAVLTVTSTDAGKPNLAIVPCVRSNLSVSTAVAVTNPALLGWDITGGTLGGRPATTVLQQRSGTGTHHFVTLLLPLAAGASNPVTAVTGTGPASARVDLADGRRFLIAADPNPTNGLRFTELLADGTTNRIAGAGFRPPSISALTNRVLGLNTNTGPLAFRVSDSDANASNLVVSARSLDPQLVPAAGLVFGGNGSNRTVTVTPMVNRAGTATIVVTVRDPDGATASTAFDVTVALPDPATFYWDTSTNAGLQAADGVWSGTNANWSATNTGSAPLAPWPVAGNDAVFLGTGGTCAVVLAGTQNVNDLTVSNGAVVFSGGALNHLESTMNLTLHGDAALNVPLTAPSNVVKTGVGRLTLGAPADFPAAFQLRNGTLRTTVDDALPVTSPLVLGDGATAALLDLTNASQQVAGLTCLTTNATVTNRLLIGAGRMLAVSGPVRLGLDATGITTRVAVNGSNGMLSVSGVNGLLQIGGGVNSLSGNNASLDLAGLGALRVAFDAGGAVRVGDLSSQTGSGLCALLLAATNEITAGLLGVGESGRASAHLLRLGTVSNAISVGTLNIGTGGRDGGVVSFATNTGTVVLRGLAGGTNRANVNMGTGGTATGANGAPVFDVRGHDADLLIGTLTMSDQLRSGTLANLFAFDRGRLDVHRLVLAQRIGGNTNNTSTLEIGGGTATLGAGGFILASNAVGILSITGGVVALLGDLEKADGGTGTAVLRLNGSNAVLDLTGHAMGSATARIDQVLLLSGTLQNVGELNGGESLVKSGSNTVVLAGTNGFRGGVQSGAGTLRLAGSLACGLSVTGGVLAGSGTLADSLVLGASATWLVQIRGVGTGDTLRLTGSNAVASLAGTLSVSADGALPNGSGFTILLNEGTSAVSGVFSGLPENATFTTSGRTWRISYAAGDGNDVALSLVAGGLDSPPQVTWLTPTNLALLTLPAALQADATDPNGDVAGVTFLADGIPVGTATTAPFAVIWSNATLGSHTLVAVAVDAGGRAATSATRQVTVAVSIPATFIAAGSRWAYFDAGTDPGAAWKGTAFDDAAWKRGPAQFGYGEGDEATVMARTNVVGATNMAFQFRRVFLVPDAALVQALNARMIRDDGAVVYVNGVEVWRDGMPTGTIDHTTRAAATISGSAETSWVVKALSPGLLVTGTNLLAAEVHQVTNTSTDVSFDFELSGTAAVLANPSLQIAGDLSWSLADGYFSLFSATSLVPPVVWTAETNNPAFSNGFWRVPVPVTGAVLRFYQLRTP